MTNDDFKNSTLLRKGQRDSSANEAENKKANDKIITQDYLSSLIKQDDVILHFEVENIYKNDKTREYKGKRELKKNPPELVIRDDSDNEVSFSLTENFNDELISALKEVERAYLGFNKPLDKNIPSNFVDRVVYYIKTNPLKLIIVMILFIATIIMFNQR